MRNDNSGCIKDCLKARLNDLKTVGVKLAPITNTM